jgi:hypothetical protein
MKPSNSQIRVLFGDFSHTLAQVSPRKISHTVIKYVKRSFVVLR